MDFMGVIIFLLLRTRFVLAAIIPNVPPSEKGDDSPEHIRYVEEALKNHSKRVILDPEWSKYVERMAQPQLPDYDPPPQDEKKAFYTERIGWSVTGFSEVPYAGVIYAAVISDEDDNDRGRKTANATLAEGKACGAVLLTAKKLLTPCACVFDGVQNYNNKYTVKGGKDSDGDQVKYLLYAEFNQIYFDPALWSFDAIYVHTYRYGFVSRDSECYGALKLQHEDPKETYATQHAFAKLEFSFITHEPLFDYIMPWPPKILFEELNEEFGVAHAVGFGFDKRPNVRKDFYDDFGRKLDLKATLLTIKLEGKCDTLNVPGYNKEGNYWEPPELICAYVWNRKNFEICGGLIGSVVVRDGLPFGTITVPINCDDGRVIIRPFYRASYWLIQNIIDTTGTPSPYDTTTIPWRKDPPSRYVAYDFFPPGEIVVKKGALSGQEAFLSLSNLLLFLDIFFILTN